MTQLSGPMGIRLDRPATKPDSRRGTDPLRMLTLAELERIREPECPPPPARNLPAPPPLPGCPARECVVKYTTPGAVDHLCADHREPAPPRNPFTAVGTTERFQGWQAINGKYGTRGHGQIHAVAIGQHVSLCGHNQSPRWEMATQPVNCGRCLGQLGKLQVVQHHETEDAP